MVRLSRVVDLLLRESLRDASSSREAWRWPSSRWASRRPGPRWVAGMDSSAATTPRRCAEAETRRTGRKRVAVERLVEVVDGAIGGAREGGPRPAADRELIVVLLAA